MNMSELQSLLDKFKVPYDEWSNNSSLKTIEDLLKEINQKQARVDIEGSRLVWSAKCVGIDVFVVINDDLYKLIEGWQLLADGKMHRRPELAHSLYEKVFPMENVWQAARRALQTQLGIPKNEDLKFTLDPLVRLLGPVRTSQYKGILTRCEQWLLQWRMPNRFYNESGYVEKREKKIISYIWQPVAEGDCHKEI